MLLHLEIHLVEREREKKKKKKKGEKKEKRTDPHTLHVCITLCY